MHASVGKLVVRRAAALAFMLLFPLAASSGGNASASAAEPQAAPIKYTNDIPDDVRDEYLTAVRSKDYKEALEIFYRVHKKHPEFAPAVYDIALALSYLGRNDEAVKTLKPLVIAVPDDKDTWKLLGDIHGEEHQYKEALDAYSAAIAADPLFFNAYQNRAATYVEVGNYAKALQDAKCMYLLQPNHRAVLTALGVCYYWSAKYEQAIHWFDKSIKIQFDMQDQPMRGLCNYALGRNVEAEKDFAKCRELVGERADDMIAEQKIRLDKLRVKKK